MREQQVEENICSTGKAKCEISRSSPQPSLDILKAREEMRRGWMREGGKNREVELREGRRVVIEGGNLDFIKSNLLFSISSLDKEEDLKSSEKT